MCRELDVLPTVVTVARAVAPRLEDSLLLVAGLGLLSTATIAPLQSLVLRHAGNAPTLSLAVNVGALNLANAVGAALRGASVADGLLRWNGPVGAAFAAAGLLLTPAALRQPRATHEQPTPLHAPDEGVPA